MKIRVWASPLQVGHSGIGIFQSVIYDGLIQHDFAVDFAKSKSNRILRFLQNFLSNPNRSSNVVLLTGSPIPLFINKPSIAIIYDLRWERVGSSLGRLYRLMDLKRTVAIARHIFVISDRTRTDLLTRFPKLKEKVSVLHLGPGIITEGDFVEGPIGAVLLIGESSHKRNELLASAFATASPTWVTRFNCVNVTDQTFETLKSHFGEELCKRYTRIDNEAMRSVYRESSVYVTLSKEEGFGIPLVEALASGCQVISIRQELTKEIVADAGVFIEDGSVAEIAAQLKSPTWVGQEIRLRIVEKYSWATTIETILNELTVVASIEN